jgi:flagellar protein FlbD
MIRLTRINQAPFVLNSDLIEHIEVTPDTVITMTNGQKFVVLEAAGEVVQRVIEFRRSVGGAFPGCAQARARPDGATDTATDSDDPR